MVAAKSAVANPRLPGTLHSAEIVADAAHAIPPKPARGFTGLFCLGEDVLREAGVEDFDRYAVQPGTPLLPDPVLGWGARVSPPAAR